MSSSTLDLEGDSGAPLLKPEDVARALNIGRTSAYALLRSGELRSVRIGRLRRVPPAALEEYISGLLGRHDEEES